jgi:hypothetical protein
MDLRQIPVARNTRLFFPIGSKDLLTMTGEKVESILGLGLTVIKLRRLIPFHPGAFPSCQHKAIERRMADAFFKVHQNVLFDTSNIVTVKKRIL